MGVTFHSVSRIAIAVAGASCSGKTTLTEAVADALDATVIRLDDYYRPYDHLTFEERGLQNFDDPKSIDDALLSTHVHSLMRGEAVEAPKYDFTRHTRFARPHVIEPKDVVIIEGLFALAFAETRRACQVRIYVDAPKQQCLDRRIYRDVMERGRSREEVLQRFNGHVWPMYQTHVAPTASHATIQVDGTRETDESVARVLAHIQSHCPEATVSRMLAAV